MRNVENVEGTQSLFRNKLELSGDWPHIQVERYNSSVIITSVLSPPP